MLAKDEVLSWDWMQVCKYYGSSHCSLIGFIAFNWVQKINRYILDNPPSIIMEEKRRVADLMLIENDTPKMCIEVETSSEKYFEKYDNIIEYLQQFIDLEYGLLVLYNNSSSKNINHDVFDGIIEKWKNDSRYNSKIGLVVIDKENCDKPGIKINIVNKGFYSFQKIAPKILIY